MKCRENGRARVRGVDGPEVAAATEMALIMLDAGSGVLSEDDGETSATLKLTGREGGRRWGR